MVGELSVLGVIPARMGSTRFPGKPLERICGQPMLWHVWKRCVLSGVLDTVVIATCDDEIRLAAEEFGAQVVMTSTLHTRANDRVSEVAQKLPADIVVNIQGDEPLVHPQLIRDVVQQFDGRPEVLCVSPVAAIVDEEDIESPHTVKVVVGQNGHTLYFSRFPVPSDRLGPRRAPLLRQVPVLGFRRQFLIDLSAMPETPLEKQESVDMLRPLEYGYPVHAVETPYQTIGVDVPGDIARAEQALADDPVYRQYAV